MIFQSIFMTNMFALLSPLGNRFKSAVDNGAQNNVWKGAESAAGYIPALDGLRGIAVMLVVLYHRPLRMATAGFIGVDVFFVLSGYLICGLLLREYEATGKISLLRFYMRRILRLMPALWVFVLVIITVVWYREGILLRPAKGGPYTGTLQQTLDGALYTVLYIVNWTRANMEDSAGWFHHTWSLAVEEQFYLLWPALLCFLVRRGGARRVFWAALALAFFSWCWRVLLLKLEWPLSRLYFGTDTRFDALMWGCALAALLHGKEAVAAPAAQQWLRFGAVVALGALLYAGCIMKISLWTSKWFYGYGCVAVAWLVVLIIFDATHNPRSFLRPLLCWSPLVQLGVISYGVYLWHTVVCGFFRWSNPSIFAEQMVTIFGGIAAAALSFYIVERPFLRLKKRFEVR